MPISPRLLLLLAFFVVGRLSAQDGIFADFSTSLGDFSCKLEFQKAPRTVANFIALATGDRAWLDLPTGAARRTPYYNGLTFHRAVSGFVIQGGSPKGDGSDGPGYTFKDEFDSTLLHSGAGVLSMANSGLNSNGSQFFITLSAQPGLNNVHSVFGSVTSGLSVVNAIGGVAVDGAKKPLSPVFMNGVTIRRVGAAALAFDANAQGLPTVGSAQPVLLKNGSNFSLQFNRSLYHEYWSYDSANLGTWTSQRIGLYVTTPPTGDDDVTTSATGQTAHFYRVPYIGYPGPLYTPPSHFGKTITCYLNDGNILVMAFNGAGLGTITLAWTGPTGAITQSSWTQEAYRARLVVYSTTFYDLVFSLAYNSAGGGTFRGTSYNTSTGTPFSGTFTSAP